MTLVIRDDANVPRTISGLFIRDDAAVSREIDELWVRDANAVSRLVYTNASTLTLAIDPTLVSGQSFGTGTATTEDATATPTGGVGPYTYSWTITSQSSPSACIINAPTEQVTSFTQTGLSTGDSEVADIECEVTDSLSATATATCQAFFTDIS